MTAGRRLVFLIPFALAVLPAPAQSAAIDYPLQNPAFTLNLPAGWLQQISPQGNLVAQPPGGSGIRLTIFALPAAIGSDAAAGRALDGFAHGNATALGIVGLVQGHAAQSLKVNDAVTMIAADYAGKFPDGTAAAYSVGFFAAGRGRYFGLVMAGSDAADKASAADQVAILHSLAPLPPR